MRAGSTAVFSGIVQDVGRVQSHEQRGGDVRLVVAVGRLDLARILPGDSICVQGCCLTATEVQRGVFAVDVSRETLSLTTLGELQGGSPVNLEPALRAGDALGGHLVSGHVDGVGRVVALGSDARSRRLTIAAPAELARYLAPKGSVAVDGVSLTINTVEQASFGVNIIPHTQTATTLGALTVGARVNLEVDQVARYLARLLAVPAP
jgi:riboflavin synthase